MPGNGHQQIATPSMTSMHSLYVLRGHEPVKEPDLLAWGKWMESGENRVVQQETIGEYFISTVFLGLDHNWQWWTLRQALATDETEPTERPQPILFETMVFHKKRDDIDYQMRCATWDEAVQQHEVAKAWVLNRC